jgi:choline kinase
MKAVILAAGIGNRLKPLTDNMPKSLIKIKGRTILERMLDRLVAAGIREVSLVVGHKKEMISAAAGGRYKTASCKYLVNPDYRLGSILSLWAAREEIGRDDIILMDADVVFEEEVLKRLLGSRNPDCFLVDKSFKDSGEEMKVVLLGGKVVQIARKITREHDAAGEGVGFCRISAGSGPELLKSLEKKICLNRLCDYEMALDDLVGKIHAGAEEVTGLNWTEIDFPEDIQKAETIDTDR